MKTKNSIENLDTKLSYEAPVLRSMEVELEYGIAAASIQEGYNQGDDDDRTFTW